MADDLVHRVVAADVLAGDEKISSDIKLRPREALRSNRRCPEKREVCPEVREAWFRKIHRTFDRRRIRENRFQGRFATKPARRSREQMPSEPSEIDLDPVIEENQHPVLLRTWLDFSQLIHLGDDSFRHQETRRQFLVVSRRPHHHCHGVPVEPDFQRLLDRHLILHFDRAFGTQWVSEMVLDASISPACHFPARQQPRIQGSSALYPRGNHR